MEESARVRPDPAEFDPYYGRYIERVEHANVLEALEEQLDEMLRLLGGLDPEIGEYRYAPGKWTLKQVVCHVLDSERIFGVRALCIARGDSQPLPGFDENAYAEEAGAERRSIRDLAKEFELVRQSTIALYRSLDDQAWQRTGNANGAAVSVRAIAWIVAGHAAHHMRVLRERYLEAR
jgi:hypothetical protein